MAAISGNTALPLVGMLIWGASSMAVGFWMVRAQREYLELYQELRGEILSPKEMADRMVEAPIRWLLEAPGWAWRYFRLLWKPHADTRLEAARMRVVRRWWLAVAVPFGGVLLPVALFVATSS